MFIKTISNTMEHANKDQASHFRLIKNNTPCLYFLMTESNAALNALRKRAAKLFFWGFADVLRLYKVPFLGAVLVDVRLQ